MLRYVHYNFVDSIETLKKVCLTTSVPIISDLDEFTNVFPCTNPVLPVRRLMILYRTQQSTLFDIRITDLHRYPAWQAYQHSMSYVHCRPTRFLC